MVTLFENGDYAYVGFTPLFGDDNLLIGRPEYGCLLPLSVGLAGTSSGPVALWALSPLRNLAILAPQNRKQLYIGLVVVKSDCRNVHVHGFCITYNGAIGDTVDVNVY